MPERLRVAWVILEGWLEKEGFTGDELLHSLGGLVVGLGVWWSPAWALPLWVPLLVGYLREADQARMDGRPRPFDFSGWSRHRQRECAAWAVGGLVALGLGSL